MKKSNIYYFIFYCLFIMAISCSKKENGNSQPSNSDLLTSQVEKIETILPKGAQKQIDPNPEAPKIETSASPELRRKLALQMQKDIEASYRKTAVVGTFGLGSHPRAFAVFKSGSTCGNYSELEIKMDCEDHRPATAASGYTGDSYVDGSKDVHLKFCFINDDYASYMGVNDGGLTNPVSTAPYGFLYLGETFYFQYENTDPNFPLHTSQFFFPMMSFIRVFDNEDSGNGNQVFEAGQQQPLIYWLSPVDNSQQAYVSGNTRLHFIVTPANTIGATPFRKTIPGIPEYGLIGKFGSYQGYISSDDEDTNNQNVDEVGAYYNRFNTQTNSWVTNPFPFSSTIEAGGNTILHISRVY